ncbi:toprim domain-containing protein [Actinomadura gamaensis]|uniref:Toprim domain-containing protein n=1 Tax=Actinomadura gamaensis TaxID=1763541 RepID=A0ABV9TUF8_9ACTN
MTPSTPAPTGRGADALSSAGASRADAERRGQIAVLRGIADHQIRQLHDGRLAWADFLDLADRHGRHGFTNVLLVNAQRTAATDVRRYDDWKAQGHQVRKNERGIRVISRRGVPYSVFDVTQTDGPTPAPSPRTPTPASEALERLVQLAADLEVYVDRGGWPYLGRPDRRVPLPGELSDDLALAVLAHQLAHVLQRGEHFDPQEGTPCRGARRVRADSIAYLTLAHLGADTRKFTFPSVTAWAGTDKRARPLTAVQTVGAQVVRTAEHFRRRLSSPPSTSTPLAPAPRTRPPSTSSPQREDLIDALSQAHKFFRDHLATSWCPAYLAERGIPSSALDAWAIGYAPANGLVQHLKSLGFTDATLHEAGLTRDSPAGPRPLFADRLMLPLRTPDGTVVGFIGRRHDTGRGPKYLNTPATALFDKSQTLFGLSEGRDQLAAGTRPLIVEGPLDVLAVRIAAPDEYVPLAPCGTAITAQQLAHLSQHAALDTVGLVLALDGDEAGQRAMLRAWKTLQQIKGPVDAVVLPKDRDPADILRYQGSMSVRESLRSVSPLPDLVVDAQIERIGGTLEHAEARVAAARAAATLIAQMPPAQITRQVPRIATATGVPHDIITTLVTDAISHDSSPPADPTRPRSRSSATSNPRSRRRQ